LHRANCSAEEKSATHLNFEKRMTGDLHNLDDITAVPNYLHISYTTSDYRDVQELRCGERPLEPVDVNFGQMCFAERTDRAGHLG
jgi:hypothetical protein